MVDPGKSRPLETRWRWTQPRAKGHSLRDLVGLGSQKLWEIGHPLPAGPRAQVLPASSVLPAIYRLDHQSPCTVIDSGHEADSISPDHQLSREGQPGLDELIENSTHSHGVL
jgi:hypothetical protein